MNTPPYTVLARSRPVRVAFLIDTKAFQPGSDRFNNLVDEIIDWCHTHWGGRTHHVVFFQGELLSDADWREMDIADPDHIVAFAPLPHKLILELHDRLEPCHIEVMATGDGERAAFGHALQSIEIPPTLENIRRTAAQHPLSSGRDAKLLLFEFSKDCDVDIRRFLHRNFGTFHQWIDDRSGQVRRIGWLENLLPQIPTHQLHVSDLASLVGALEHIGGNHHVKPAKYPLSYVSPAQLSSVGTGGVYMGGRDGPYSLIIGDLPDDIWNHWNAARWTCDLTEQHRYQLWIPSALAMNPDFWKGITPWLLSQMSYRNGAFQTHMQSSSHTPEQLNSYGKIVCSQKLHPHITFDPARAPRDLRRPEEVVPRTKVEFRPWHTAHDTVRLTGVSPSQVFTIEEPSVISPWAPGGRWMLDIQIEHVSPDGRNSGESAWWALPRRGTASVLHQMFRRPSRINRDGHFSVSCETGGWSARHVSKPQLAINLIAERRLVSWLLTRERYSGFHTTDAREGLRNIPTTVHHVEVSTKGSYLLGLVGLFRGFGTAHVYFERTFWRRLFKMMSHGKAENDLSLTERIAGVLKGENSSKVDAQPDLADARVKQICRMLGERLQGQVMTFLDCVRLKADVEKEAIPNPLTYVQGRMMVERHDVSPITKDELKDGLRTLLELGALRLGIETRCPRCQVRGWCHVDNLCQRMTCVGCGEEYCLRESEEWSYSLNSLVQRGVTQGVLGVLYAAATVQHHARWFFAYSPSLDLYRGVAKTPWREIDFACVVDGALIVAEVKDGFAQAETLSGLVEAAAAVRADRAVLFLPHGRARQQAEELGKWLAAARVKAEPLSVAVELVELPEF